MRIMPGIVIDYDNNSVRNKHQDKYTVKITVYILDKDIVLDESFKKGMLVVVVFCPTDNHLYTYAHEQKNILVRK